MELQVFSDPLAALAGDAGLPYDEVNEVTLYDEELVKPALLLADQVTLRTWRLDMQFGEKIAGVAATLGVPLAENIRRTVSGDHPGVIRRLGLSDDLIRDLRRALDLYDRKDGLPQHAFFETDAVDQFVEAWMGYHRGQHQALRSNALEQLTDAAVVIEKPWDDRDMSGLSFPAASWTYDNESFSYGWERMVKELDEGSSAVLLDRGIDGRLRSAQVPVVQPGGQTLENAASLMQMVDGLSTASLDEVADIRNDLADHLKPFRSFILRHAGDLDIDPDLPMGERQRRVAIKWEADVSPVVDDLRHKIEDDKFLRKLGSVAGSGPEAAIGVGLGITTTIATGGIGLLAVAGLGVAAAPTIIKAAAASRAGQRENSRNGAYLVVQMEDRMRKRLQLEQGK